LVWAKRGERDRILVHVDAHDDFRPIGDARKQRVQELLDSGQLGVIAGRMSSGRDELMNEGNYLSAATHVGMVKEIYWVVAFGSRATPQLQVADRQALREIGFSDEQVRSFRIVDGRLTGVLYGVPFVVCGLRDLPRFDEPVLLDVDADLFSVLANLHSLPIVESLAAFRRDLVAVGLTYDVVTVARSVDGGYTELEHAYIAEAVHDLLSSRKRTLSTDDWSLLRRRAQAEIQHRTGQLDAAIETDLSILVEYPNDAQAHYHLALMYSDKEDCARTLFYAERAARLDPMYEPGIVDLGRSLVARGRPEGNSLLERAEVLTPGSHLVARARGDLAFDQGLYRLALSHYVAIADRADMALAMRIGDAYMLLEDYDDALMYYDLGLGIGENRVSPRYDRFASSWLLLGSYYENVVYNPELARQYFERYLRAAPDPAARRASMTTIRARSKLYD
jgi:tetratricopeptide (TPR) repeat protein